jgi:phosphatidylglycerophosphate synthase
MVLYRLERKFSRGFPLNIATGQEFRFSINVPHIFTSIRAILSIAVICLLAIGNESQFIIAGILLIVAALTDWADGFLARRLHQTSLVGSLFDMLADQFLFIPNLILAVVDGRFARTASLVVWNPYLYAVPALLGGVFVLAGIGIYLWKRRRSAMVFPTPTLIAKINYWFWIAPLVLAVLGIGPDILLAVLMYAALITTLLSFYTYLKKGGYVFTK